jgi:hypothetical protein
MQVEVFACQACASKESVMLKTKGQFSGCRIHSRPRIGVRLWMLAATALLFSLMLQLIGSQPQRATCCLLPEGSIQLKAPVISHKAADKAPVRVRKAMLVPVGFKVSGLAIPVKPDRVFSHRKIDEFLQHETQGSAGGGDRLDTNDALTF